MELKEWCQTHPAVSAQKVIRAIQEANPEISGTSYYYVFGLRDAPPTSQPEEMSSCFLVWYRSPRDVWDKTNFLTALAAFWKADLNREWSLDWESVRCVGLLADKCTRDQLHFKADPAFALKPTEAMALFQQIVQYQIPRIISVHTTTHPTPWLNADSTESSNAMRLVQEGLTKCLTSQETYAGVAKGIEAPECNYARTYVIEPVFKKLMHKYEPGKEHSQVVVFAGPTGELTPLAGIKFESVALCSVDTTYHHCDFLLGHVGHEYNLMQISSYGGFYGVVGCMLGDEADVLDGQRSDPHFKEIMTYINDKCKGRWWTTRETRAFLTDCVKYAEIVRTRERNEDDAELWREQLSFAREFSEKYFGVTLARLGQSPDKLWQDWSAITLSFKSTWKLLQPSFLLALALDRGKATAKKEEKRGTEAKGQRGGSRDTLKRLFLKTTK